MKIKPLKGMNDYLPAQAELRDYLQRKICEVYEDSGFQRIYTPIVEDIENLDKSEGGDNLNLIFKIMKRGEKLKKAMESGDSSAFSDMGLRYDLTLPLSRYYANNRASLPTPFKVIQMDRVYRAERPQKGRMREFTQCDIDILGSDSPNCEIELIHTTAKALLAIGIDHFKVKVNDNSLQNTSTVEAENISLGEYIRINCSAQKGSGDYTYAVWYKKSSATSWTTKQNYSTNRFVSIKPSSRTTYNVSVKVKDSNGNISKKTFNIKVQ